MGEKEKIVALKIEAPIIRDVYFFLHQLTTLHLVVDALQRHHGGADAFLRILQHQASG
jgi:hypothetical protein